MYHPKTKRPDGPIGSIMIYVGISAKEHFLVDQILWRHVHHQQLALD
jgi:hypothetical protein